MSRVLLEGHTLFVLLRWACWLSPVSSGSTHAVADGANFLLTAESYPFARSSIGDPRAVSVSQ